MGPDAIGVIGLRSESRDHFLLWWWRYGPSDRAYCARGYIGLCEAVEVVAVGGDGAAGPTPD